MKIKLIMTRFYLDCMPFHVILLNEGNRCENVGVMERTCLDIIPRIVRSDGMVFLYGGGTLNQVHYMENEQE